MAGNTTGCCSAIGCCDPVTNFIETARKGVITLRDGIKKSVVYVGVGKFFEYAKQVTGNIEGWKKLAGIIIPVAALALETDVESISDPLGILAAQFESFKLIQGGLAWIGVGDDFYKKEWVENHKSKNHHGENYVGCIKRIGLIAVNCLKLVTFGGKLGIIAEVSLKIGSVPVMSLLLAGTTVLSLIGNGLTFWTNYVDDKEVNDKIARFQDDELVTEEKMNALKDKLRALIAKNESGDSEVDLSSEDSTSEEMGEAKEEPKNIDEFTYVELKKEIALKKAEKKQAEVLENLNAKRAMLEEKRVAINDEEDAAAAKALMDEASALYSAYSKIAAEHFACKANVKALKNMKADRFEGYKFTQYFGRLADLKEQRTKTWIDVACNVATLVGLGLGLGKAYYGVEAIASYFDVKESAINIVISSVQLLTGFSELGKFFYDENHKEGKKQSSVAEFAALCAA